MIGKGKSIGHTVNAIEYAENKLNAIELDRNMLVGKNPREIAEEFRIFQDMNSRCKRNTFSFVISPSIEDSKNLSTNDYREITQDFLKKMNLDQNQYIAYIHKDRAHNHIHLYTNRIDLKGIASKDNYIGKKSQRAAEEIAIERNMIVAREVQKEKVLQLQNELRKETDFIKLAHKRAINNKPKNLKEYANFMNKQGIKPHIKYAKSGKCVGIKFEIGDKMIKGSTIGKVFSGMRIEKAILELSKTIIKTIGRSL